ncbi:IS110 family transposase [Spirosoma taeanense]|uniref:IS110 family transposase n=1 Tax=Spirosoma taeanense TaxID=2735870 RepID=A0A6M5Y8L1_9BACT|nr:IS110 family transposase [Spirosoma taeanense]QJW89102.1 IS110 family transposase [Spirosoma taeanense]
MNQQTQDYRKMPIVHQQVAGVDIGSQFHVVAIGDDPKQHVQQFGVSTKELFRLAQWLTDNQVKHVAMEATGGYERPLVNVLQEADFEVLVTAGANTKNYRRFKSDTSDAIHIRTLHSLGLLPPIFLPDEFSTLIRPLVRLRRSLVEDAADYIRRIQKALRAGNVRLDAVLTDTNSVSGLRIIAAICQGQEDPLKLAELVDSHCKKKPAEIIELLGGNWNGAMRFEVRSNYRLYLNLQAEIAELDKELDQHFTDHTKGLKQPTAVTDPTVGRQKLRQSRNTPRLPIEQYAHKLLGVDLSNIPGFGRDALLTFIAEVGESISKFHSAKAFAKWLGFTPNNKASGGKVLSKKTLKNKSTLPNTFRMVANSLGNMKKPNPMTAFFQRIAYRAGRIKAITATARKLAVVVYKMLTTGEAYEPAKLVRDIAQVKQQQIRQIRKKLAKFEITGQDLGLFATLGAA